MPSGKPESETPDADGAVSAEAAEAAAAEAEARAEAARARANELRRKLAAEGGETAPVAEGGETAPANEDRVTTAAEHEPAETEPAPEAADESAGPEKRRLHLPGRRTCRRRASSAVASTRMTWRNRNSNAFTACRCELAATSPRCTR